MFFLCVCVYTYIHNFITYKYKLCIYNIYNVITFKSSYIFAFLQLYRYICYKNHIFCYQTILNKHLWELAQERTVGKHIDSKIGHHRSIFRLKYITSGKARQLTSLCINFFTYKMRIIVILIPASCTETEYDMPCEYNTMSGIQEAFNVCYYVSYFLFSFSNSLKQIYVQLCCFPTDQLRQMISSTQIQTLQFSFRRN